METLLILDQERTPELRSAITRHGLRIVQEISPRVVLVEGETANLTATIREPGVLSISSSLSSQNEPAGILANLTTAETLFVNAWIQQQTKTNKTKKKRPCDGLDWDTPGYAAP